MDPFLKSFIVLYLNNKEVRESLLVALMHGLVSKLNRHKNPRLPEVAMNFFIAADATSRKCFDFLSANVVGPCLRTIQRHNSRKNKTPLLISSSVSVIEARLNDFIDLLTLYLEHGPRDDDELNNLDEEGDNCEQAANSLDETHVVDIETLTTLIAEATGGG